MGDSPITSKDAVKPNWRWQCDNPYCDEWMEGESYSYHGSRGAPPSSVEHSTVTVRSMHMDIGKKFLVDATDEEIKKFAASYRYGYEFSDEDCQDIRKPVGLFHFPKDETVAEAVDDFIRAYEN